MYLEKCEKLHVNLFDQCFRERPKSGNLLQAGTCSLVALHQACLALIDGLLYVKCLLRISFVNPVRWF